MTKEFPVLWQGTREHIALLTRLGCPKSVPWSLVKEHESQCLANHHQSVQRLAERGGLSPEELVCVLRDLPYRFAHNTEISVKELLEWLA